ncbi:MAG: hypothetical protein AAGK04_10535 [Planctomycetota bacterium]
MALGSEARQVVGDDETLTPPQRVAFALQADELEQRLAALDPSEPREYYRLAEEVADRLDSPERLALARRLFVLALELDRARPAPSVAGPACRALASLATSENDRRWLEALARQFEASSVGEAVVFDPERVAPELGHRAATAFGLARAGRAHLVGRYLDDPDVVALIQRYDELLRVDGLPGALNWLESQIESWPVTTGSLDRIERVRGAQPPRYQLDSTNGGNPGPRLTDRELVAFLRLESRLLSGIHRSWAAQIAADLGAPLRDADAATAARTLGIDASRTLYREGAWVSPLQSPPTPDPAPDTIETDAPADYSADHSEETPP